MKRRTKKSLASGTVPRVILASAVFALAFSIGTFGVDMASQFSAAGNSVQMGAPKDCGEAKKRALSGEKENDGPAKGLMTGVKSGKTELDECFSAFMSEQGKKKKEKGIKLTEADYECHGRQAVTNVQTGKVADSSIPSKSVPQGKCDRKVVSKDPNKGGGGGEQKQAGGEQKGGGGGEGMKMPEMKGGDDKGGQPQQPQTQSQSCAGGVERSADVDCQKQNQPFYCNIPFVSSAAGCSQNTSASEPSGTKAADELAKLIGGETNTSDQSPASVQTSGSAQVNKELSNTQQTAVEQKTAAETSAVKTENSYTAGQTTGFQVPANTNANTNPTTEAVDKGLLQTTLSALQGILQGMLRTFKPYL